MAESSASSQVHTEPMTDKDVEKSGDTNHAQTAVVSTQPEKKISSRPTVVSDDAGAPDGGYGWICVLCCALINAHTWGMNSSYAVFLAYYLNNNVFPGGTPLQYAFIGGLSISMALFISPVATTITRIWGTRTTLLIGVAFETASFIGASFTSKIWHLFLSQGVCFGIGLGLLFVGSVPVVAQWFTTKRSLASGLAAAGSGMGGLIYSLAANAMIGKIGLPWTFRVLGIVAGIVNLISSLLLRDRNKAIGSSQGAFDLRLFRSWAFWVLLGFGVFSMLGYVVVLFSVSSYASRIGLSAKQGSVISAILNLGQMLGRPPVGYFSDSVGRLNMAGITSFLSGLLVLVVWVNAKSYGVLIFYALIGGGVLGSFWAVVAPVTAEVMGLRELPAALSITWVALTLPTLFSEPIGLEIVAFNDGSYLGAQIFAGIMYIAAAACCWVLKAWKIGQLETIAADTRCDAEQVDPIQQDIVEVAGQEKGEHSPVRDQDRRKTSSFVHRLFKIQKV